MTYEPPTLPDRRQRYSDKHMKHIFFSILTTIAFCTCEAPPKPPKSTLNCYMRFDAAAASIKAEATLRDGATSNFVDIAGGIRFQATAMRLLPMQGLTYALEYPAKFIAEPSFDWSDKSGKPLRYSFKAPAIDSFYFDTPTLSTTKASKLHWAGESLAANETMIFIWENAEGSRTERMEVSSTFGAPVIEMPAAKIAQLPPGKWSLYLVRKRSARSEVGDFKVENVAEYYTRPIQVTIR